MPTVEVFGILARKAATVRAVRGVHPSATFPAGYARQLDRVIREILAELGRLGPDLEMSR